MIESSAASEMSFSGITLSSAALPILESGGCSRSMLKRADRFGMMRDVRKSSVGSVKERSWGAGCEGGGGDGAGAFFLRKAFMVRERGQLCGKECELKGACRKEGVKGACRKECVEKSVSKRVSRKERPVSSPSRCVQISKRMSSRVVVSDEVQLQRWMAVVTRGML